MGLIIRPAYNCIDFIMLDQHWIKCMSSEKRNKDAVFMLFFFHDRKNVIYSKKNNSTIKLHIVQNQVNLSKPQSNREKK